jgi:hypothetical protein
MNGTYKQLRDITEDMNILNSNRNSAAWYLNRQRIKDFYEKNAIRLRMMVEFSKGLAAKYVQMNEEGKTVKQEDGQFVFLSEEAKEEYTLAYNDFLKQEIQIY